MMQQSAKKAAEQLQPVRRYLEACWNSPKKFRVFCLVEGEFDKHIYESRLNSNNIEVIIAADDNLRHHRGTVQFLVSHMRKLHPKGRYIGIRDKDYMHILGQVCPEGIYVTDHRDIEMMISASPSFQKSMPDFESCLENVFTYCVPFAFIRIFAESKALRTILNNVMNITAVYNQQQKKYATNASALLRKIYFTKVDPGSCEEELDSFISTHHLESHSPYDICRGHDVLGLIEFVYGHTLSKNNIEKSMETYYDLTDFYNTTLFANICKYCKAFGIDAHA